MFTLPRIEGIHFQAGSDAGKQRLLLFSLANTHTKTGPQAGEVTQRLQSTVKVPLSKAPYL